MRIFNRRGQSIVEWMVLFVSIAAGIIAAAGVLRGAANDAVTSAASKISSEVGKLTQ